jgi:hypothetical protein
LESKDIAMHIAIRTAGFGLMTMFVSCGVGASFTATPQEAPAKDLQSNWLPAPNGPFYGVLRLYLPKPEVASGQWKMPLLTPVSQQNQ